jgi:asparagine synthase (glutamine-hydrolysing)
MKAIQRFCASTKLDTFPPGHFYTPETGFKCYYEPLWRQPNLEFHEADLSALRDCLIEATKKRLMSDAPLGMVIDLSLFSCHKKKILFMTRKHPIQINLF